MAAISLTHDGSMWRDEGGGDDGEDGEAMDMESGRTQSNISSKRPVLKEAMPRTNRLMGMS